LGAGTALITGGDPLSGGVGAVVGEAMASAYRNGTFGNIPLDQNSPDYEARVEYGVKVAKVVTALCVGYAGGDIDAAVCSAENAARHNACAVFFDPNERTLTQEEQAEKDRLEIERFRAWNAQRIASGNLNTVEQLCELYNTPLPDQVLGAFASINEPIQEWQDNVQNTIQVAHAISPVTGFIANRTLGGIPNTLELFKLPTSCGGTLLTLAPGLNYVGAAGKVALNTVKGSLKSMVSALRGAGTNASRLGPTGLGKPLSLQGAGNLNDKMGTSVLQSSPGYPASSVKQAQLLRNSLISEELGAGHAFEKHIVKQGEFPGWIRTRSQFTQHIEQVLNDPLTHSKVLSNNKTAYWHSPTSTVVIRNPNAIDGGTVFQPLNGINYFRELR
jgi:hypothetical protein